MFYLCGVEIDKKMLIVFNKVQLPEFTVYSPDGKLFAICNEYEILDIRVQIATQRLDGWYFTCEFEGELYIINIDQNGRSNNYPEEIKSYTDYRLNKTIELRTIQIEREIELIK
jgi:hypothetical protein